MVQDGKKEMLIKPPSQAVRKSLRYKNNHKCMYCGEPLYRLPTCCEHVIPQVLIKYVEYDAEALETFKSLYEDSRNMYLIHKGCLHTGRSYTILDDEGIENLYVSRANKRELKALTVASDYYISKYYALSEQISQLQHNRCYLCESEIMDIREGTLRRKDDEKSRFEVSNVMLVCKQCNVAMRRVRWDVLKAQKDGTETIDEQGTVEQAVVTQSAYESGTSELIDEQAQSNEAV